MILVPRGHARASTIVRDLPVFGYQDREGHAELDFTDVRVPVTNLLGQEGSGFAIAQARLGPGRIHHCMRCIGVAERALDLMCRRVTDRVAFGRPLAEQGVIREWIADSRIEIEQARLLTLKAAYLMDTVGTKGAAIEISAIKVVAPNVALQVVDRAIQAHGGGGVSRRLPAGPHVRRRCAPCASPTAPTRCTAGRWPAPRWPATSDPLPERGCGPFPVRSPGLRGSPLTHGGGTVDTQVAPGEPGSLVGPRPRRGPPSRQTTMILLLALHAFWPPRPASSRAGGPARWAFPVAARPGGRIRLAAHRRRSVLRRRRREKLPVGPRSSDSTLVVPTRRVRPPDGAPGVRHRRRSCSAYCLPTSPPRRAPGRADLGRIAGLLVAFAGAMWGWSSPTGSSPCSCSGS